VIRHGIGRIAYFETGLADAYRILTVLAEPRRPRPKAGIEPTHSFKDFSLKGYIGSRKTADFADLVPVVDDWDVIFTQLIGISRFPIKIDPGENPSLYGIERAYAIGLQMFDQPQRMNDHIVIDNEKNFALCETEASV
jgi:hypothetical protein